MKMPVLIKKVDPELYTKFKARAIERGLKIDEAFNEAIAIWLKSSKDKTSRDRIQERNEISYRLLKNIIEKEYLNKWIAIINGQLEVIAETREKLFEELKEKKVDENPALIFRVGDSSRRRTFGIKKIERIGSS